MESFVTLNVMHASLCHMTSVTFQGGYSAMFIASKEGSFWSKKGSVPFENSLE